MNVFITQNNPNEHIIRIHRQAVTRVYAIEYDPSGEAPGKASTTESVEPDGNTNRTTLDEHKL